MRDAARVVGGAAASGVDHEFFLGADRDPGGADRHVQLGQHVDAVLECLDVDIPACRNQAVSHALHKETHASAGAGQQALAGGNTGVAGAGKRNVFPACDMGGSRRAGGDSDGAGQHQMWCAEFRVLIGLRVGGPLALDILVLRLQGPRDLVLISRLLRQQFARHAGKGVLLLARHGQALCRLRQILVMFAGVGAHLGGEQHAATGAQHPMRVRSQFEALTARHAARGSRMREIADIQRRGRVVAHQRRADLAGGVVQPQLVGAAALVFLGFDGIEDVVPGQFVRRQVRRPVRSSGNDRLVAIAVQEVDDHFLPDARDRHVAPGRARPVLRHADPARAVFVVLA
ncbi:hypothetical protein D3C71_1358980 [compost metagenome]